MRTYDDWKTRNDNEPGGNTMTDELLRAFLECAEDGRTIIITCQGEGCGAQVEAKRRSRKYCVACSRERALEYKRQYNRLQYAANPEKFREQARRRYAANSEKYRARDRRWRTVNREKLNEQARNRRAANPERYRENNRRSRAANLEKYREKYRRYRAANLQQERERSRLYRKANREKITERRGIRRAQMIALENIFYRNQPARSRQERRQRHSALLVVARKRGWFTEATKTPDPPKEG